MPRKKSTKKEYTLERSPVVTMLGHVDHGKTSILDVIRGTKVQVSEEGGITQSVRAHKVKHTTKDGSDYFITFVDTPGHEAFSEMRSRGAKVTDIAVLVVACDDGVQPQTKEAIAFAKEEKVPIVVALNKIDIKGTDKAKVKRDLATEGVQVEELGGDVIIVETSAKKKRGISDLLDAILLTAEMHQIKKNKLKEGIGEAIVLESTLDKSLGAISLCLMKAGEVSVGDWVGWEDKCGRIRAIKDEFFNDLSQAFESDPCWFIGFNTLIPIGVKLTFFKNKQEAKSLDQVEEVEEEEPTIEETEDDEEEETLDEEVLSQLLEARQDEDIPQLNVIVKAESQGTLEVVKSELEKLSNKETKVNIIEAGTGDITNDDIIKAKEAHGIVLGFRSNLNKNNAKIAQQERVLVRNYQIIYELLDEVEDVMESFKEPEEVEVEVARAQVKKVFELSDGSKVAGCKVIKGTILKGYQCYVERPSVAKEDEKRIGDGKITSLKHGKEEVHEAPKGTECGIFIEPQVDVEKDDEIVCYKIEKE
jgi:translation initiation factor IF-2